MASLTIARTRRLFLTRRLLALRTLTTSPIIQQKGTEVEPTVETTEVEEMSDLLRRTKTEAALTHKLIPMRSSALWADILQTPPLSESGDPASTKPASGTNVSAESLPARRMSESYCQLELPFKSDPLFLEQYTNARGGIRTGKIMEHLDSIAGSSAYRYVIGENEEVERDPQRLGYYIVTAAIDRLDMLKPLTPHNVKDLRLSGQVIYVGRSSMEVAVKMESIEDGVEETMMLGRFSMVCRDSATHKARSINPLKLVTEEERALYKLGEAHKNRKQKRTLEQLNRAPPSSVESEMLHDLFLSRGEIHREPSYVLPDGSERVWISDTKIESIMQMYPQDRNIHSKIFGGYLMRLAYELGYANASMFCKDQLRFLSLDGIYFKLPVPIGCILRLTSKVTHTYSTPEMSAVVHAWVQANVIDPHTGKEETTNDFFFTWCRDEGEPLQRTVVPRTYGESMRWLSAKRALDLGAEIRGLRYKKSVEKPSEEP